MSFSTCNAACMFQPVVEQLITVRGRVRGHVWDSHRLQSRYEHLVGNAIFTILTITKNLEVQYLALLR